MIMAAFGGLRGSMPVLRALLDAVDAEGIQTIVNTGDCVVGHPSPNDVIECLCRRRIPTVQGLWDRRVAWFHQKQKRLRAKSSPEEFALIEETYRQCKSENLEYLHALPRTRTLVVDGIRIGLCHGTFTSQSECLRHDDDDALFRRQREIQPLPIIVCGGAPEGFVRTVDETLFVNPGRAAVAAGSAGVAPDGTERASYAVISTEEEPFQAELTWVDYPSSS